MIKPYEKDIKIVTPTNLPSELKLVYIKAKRLVVEREREVINVYKDESRKPLVSYGLNKSAEVALLNIKCMNKLKGLNCYTQKDPKLRKTEKC